MLGALRLVGARMCVFLNSLIMNLEEGEVPFKSVICPSRVSSLEIWLSELFGHSHRQLRGKAAVPDYSVFEDCRCLPCLGSNL